MESGADVAFGGHEGTGTYVTNGVFLYRVIEIVQSQGGAVVELEDCYFLDVVRVPINTLDTRCLRVVTPASSQ